MAGHDLITVVGGTGKLGRVVVADLLAAGHRVRVLSRHAPAAPATEAAPLTREPEAAPPTKETEAAPIAEHRVVDLLTGAGLDDALAGSTTVVHCATGPRGDDRATAHLTASAARAGVGHLVYVSIVGVDRIRYFYYAAKLAAERAVEAGTVPWTILRATQFHDLLTSLWHGQRRLPLILAPRLVFQPVDVRDVAARLVDIATSEPAARVDDMGGPEVREARDLARAYLDATGRRRPIVGISLPGKAFRAYRSGAHVTPYRATGVVTYEQFLARRFGPAPAPGATG